MPPRLPKPSVIANPAENQQTAAGERIIRVTNNNPADPKGALISLRTNNDGSFTIHVYGRDPGVSVDTTDGSDATIAARVMELFDAGSNMLGKLDPEIRARLWAVVDRPGERTWTDTHGIIINRLTTLWQALLKWTDYPIRTRDADGPWPLIPTTEQLVTALSAELSPDDIR